MQSKDTSSYRLFLGLAMALAVALRLAAVVEIPTVPTSDFWSYFQRAVALSDRQVYEAIPGRPDASYPPGYPILLSLLFRLPFDRLIAAKLLNVALGAVAVLLMAVLTRQLFGETASIVSCFILAVSPRAILLPLLVASENLFLPLLTAWAIVSIRGLGRLEHTSSFRAGALAALCTLIRVVAAGLSLPWLVALATTRPPRKRFLLAVATFIGIQAAILLPWAARNLVALDYATPLTSTAGINLFIGNNARATGQWYPWLDDMRSIDPHFASRSIAAQDSIARKSAIAWIAHNPGSAASLYLSKLALIMKHDLSISDSAIFGNLQAPPSPPVDVVSASWPHDQYRPFVDLVLNAFYWMLLPLAFLSVAIGLATPRYRPNASALPRFVLVLSTALYFPLISAMFLANTRFHWPTADLLIPFAAAALVTVFTTLRTKLFGSGPTTRSSRLGGLPPIAS